MFVENVAPEECRGWWYVSARFHTREVKDHEGFEKSVQAVVDFAEKEVGMFLLFFQINKKSEFGM